MERVEKELEATVRQPANAEKYRMEQIAEAKRQKVILEAEAEAEAIRVSMFLQPCDSQETTFFLCSFVLKHGFGFFFACRLREKPRRSPLKQKQKRKLSRWQRKQMLGRITKKLPWLIWCWKHYQRYCKVLRFPEKLNIKNL